MSMLLAEWGELAGPRRRELTRGKQTALTIGVFDGVHRGHRALIEKIIQRAEGVRGQAGSPESSLVPAVVTFRNHPKTKPGAILGFNERTALFESAGIALCVVIDFSPDFGKMSGRVFTGTLCRYLNPAYMAVGADFHCGYRRSTGAKAFKALAESMGVTVELVEPVLEGGKPISSTRIRAALEAGNYGEAELLLGRAIPERQ